MNGADSLNSDERATRKRKYDKGERRFKHVGRSAEASVDDGNPKKVIGKCPNNIPDDVKLAVLQTAIAERQEERGEPFPSRMFAVYQGTIYDCRTTTGESYHAFPYQGEMLRSLHDLLAACDDAKRHAKAFRNWVAKHVRLL